MTNRFPAYRSSYNSRNTDIDSSTHTDSSSVMDVSLHSHQNFLESRDTHLDLESEVGRCECYFSYIYIMYIVNEEMVES